MPQLGHGLADRWEAGSRASLQGGETREMLAAREYPAAAQAVYESLPATRHFTRVRSESARSHVLFAWTVEVERRRAVGVEAQKLHGRADEFAQPRRGGRSSLGRRPQRRQRWKKGSERTILSAFFLEPEQRRRFQRAGDFGQQLRCRFGAPKVLKKGASRAMAAKEALERTCPSALFQPDDEELSKRVRDAFRQSAPTGWIPVFASRGSHD